MESQKLHLMGCEIEKLSQQLCTRFSMNSRFTSKQGDVEVLLREKFYFRISSNLSFFAILDFQQKGECALTLIAAGGKHGPFGFSYGAEKNMLEQAKKEVRKLAVENHWQEVQK